MTIMAASEPVHLDELDRTLIGLLRAEPHLSLAELARRAGVPRATAQSRRSRLERVGVVTGYGPDVAAERVGYGVTAFTVLEIVQGAHATTVDELRKIPEVLEVHTVTGAGDLLCRLVARSNDDLHRVLQRVTAIPTIGRSQTQIALSTQLQRAVVDLVAAGAVPRGRGQSVPGRRSASAPRSPR
jgi:DNA-binding Lrp family transcriptional regulator